MQDHPMVKSNETRYLVKESERIQKTAYIKSITDI